MLCRSDVGCRHAKSPGRRMYTPPESYRISTTSRYLFPPMLKTVRRAPRKLAVGKSSRSSWGD